MYIFDNVLKYVTNLGKFWHNFNGLEMVLRLFLYSKSGGSNTKALTFLDGPVGREYEDNFITNYMSFGQLCDAFNSHLNRNEKIDFSKIIDLRDAMAHGRVAGDVQGNMSVIKYSKPKQGKVVVEFHRAISVAELEKIIDEINDMTHRVSSHIK